MSRTRLIALLMPIVLVAATAVASVPAPTFAASLEAHTGPAGANAAQPMHPTCLQQPNHTDCDGQNPYDSGCAGSGISYYVVESQPLRFQNDPNNASWSYGYVQLWWSDKCQTNWTRTVTGSAIGTASYTTAYVSAGGVPEYNPNGPCPCNVTFSYQVYAMGIPATSCGEVVGATQADWYQVCFSQ